MTTFIGNNSGIDMTLKSSTELNTSTSQYLVVGIQGGTTAADLTAYMANAAATLADTTTARSAIGVNTTARMSSGSTECNVRVMGLAKMICAASIASGDWVNAYEGASTTTRRGQINVAGANGASCSSYGQTITAQTTILGKALRSGSTNSVIEVMMLPQLYDRNLLGEV